MSAPKLLLVDPSAAVDFASRLNGTSIYALKPGVTQHQIHDHLCARLAQLQGMLALTYAEEGVGLHELLCDELKDLFFWGCYDVAEECRALAGLLYTTDPVDASDNTTGAIK